MNIQLILQNYELYLDSNAFVTGLNHQQARPFLEHDLYELLKSNHKKLVVSKEIFHELQQVILSGSAKSKVAKLANDLLKKYQDNDLLKILNQSLSALTKQVSAKKPFCFIVNYPQHGGTLVHLLKSYLKDQPEIQSIDYLKAFKFNKHGLIENWFNSTNAEDQQFLDYNNLNQQERMKSIHYLANYAKDHLIFFDSTCLLSSLNHEHYKTFYTQDLPKILKESDQKLFLSKNLFEGLERSLELLQNQMDKEQNLSEDDQNIGVYQHKIKMIEKAFKLIHYYLDKNLAVRVEQTFDELLKQLISHQRSSIFVFNNPQLFTQLQNILRTSNDEIKQTILLARMTKQDGHIDIVNFSDLEAREAKLSKHSKSKEKESVATAVIPKNQNIEEISNAELEPASDAIIVPKTQIQTQTTQPVLATQSLSIKDIVKYYKIFFDTSALVHSAKSYHTQLFLTQELPYALHQCQNKVIIPVKVLDELEKLTKDLNIVTRQNSQKVFSIIQMYLTTGIAELKGEDWDTFPDHIFQVIFTRYRLTHNLLLITNDHNLAIDLLNIGSSFSVQSHKSIKLFRFVDSPPEVIKDWQEILHGDDKLRNHSPENASVFNIQTNRDAIYRQLKKHASSWDNID